MLKCVCKDIEATTKTALSALQSQVDSNDSQAEKYSKAKALFSNKNTKAFKDIKKKLGDAAPPGDACVYCERDRYRDIDHIRPKRHYPQEAFIWENYIFACTICNQDAKKDTYAVLDAQDKIIKFDRTLLFTQPVPTGSHLLIDPRTEDPLSFLFLDLETGRFVVNQNGTLLDREKGIFTRDLFNLNETSLSRIRVQAFTAFKDYLTRHKECVAKADLKGAQRILEEINELPHPTVLVEMRRQCPLTPMLNDLFTHVPPEIGRRP